MLWREVDFILSLFFGFIVCLCVLYLFFNFFLFVCFCRIACIDAMIDQVDKNKDYKLDQTEFTDLLKPELVPFSKGMILPFTNARYQRTCLVKFFHKMIKIVY